MWAKAAHSYLYVINNKVRAANNEGSQTTRSVYKKRVLCKGFTFSGIMLILHVLYFVLKTKKQKAKQKKRKIGVLIQTCG